MSPFFCSTSFSLTSCLIFLHIFEIFSFYILCIFAVILKGSSHKLTTQSKQTKHKQTKNQNKNSNIPNNNNESHKQTKNDKKRPSLSHICLWGTWRLIGLGFGGFFLICVCVCFGFGFFGHFWWWSFIKIFLLIDIFAVSSPSFPLSLDSMSVWQVLILFCSRG